jgi:maleylacetate reductase
MTREVRFGAGALSQLGDVCAVLEIRRPLLVTTARGARSARGLTLTGVYDGVKPHVPIETVQEVVALAESLESDGLVALGGGSAIDTAKAAVAELATRRPESTVRVIAIPTTYAGAEWTPFFGTLLAPGRKGGGASDVARPIAAIYDPELTLGLPLEETVGTAMNALAHCAEAYYHPDATRRAARHADTGATAIGYALPLVVAEPLGIYGRTRLLEGAMRAAEALGASGLCLAHAMAQAVGGRYGVAQGAANAVCLPVALRFNREAVPEAIARFGAALGVEDPTIRCAELAALGGFGRLRDLGVPRDDLGPLAAATAERAGTKANPRDATAGQIEALFEEVW